MLERPVPSIIAFLYSFRSSVPKM